MSERGVRVVCRIRPLNPTEVSNNDEICTNITGPQTIKVKDHTFIFDHVFNLNSTQKEIYADSGENVIKDVLAGYNATVFAYGQTSSGKTFTMQGPDINDDEFSGIIPRMIISLFREAVSAPEDTEFLIKASYMEIYMEKIRDLLDSSKDNLRIREDLTRGIYVEGSTEVFVSTVEEVYSVLTLGQSNRAIAETKMNALSSRSHSVLMLHVVQKTSTKSLSSKLCLVDLAGSEKVGKTGAAGSTLDEAKKINLSLSALGNVINSLTDGKSSHIPYRDSKLTRMLQESLGGNATTTLIVCCSPSVYNMEETISTLRFGVRAKTVKNKATLNIEQSAAELKILLEKANAEITRLRKELRIAKGLEEKEDDEAPVVIAPEYDKLNERIKLLESELERVENEKEKLNDTISTMGQSITELNALSNQLKAERDKALERITQFDPNSFNLVNGEQKNGSIVSSPITIQNSPNNNETNCAYNENPYMTKMKQIQSNVSGDYTKPIENENRIISPNFKAFSQPIENENNLNSKAFSQPIENENKIISSNFKAFSQPIENENNLNSKAFSQPIENESTLNSNAFSQPIEKEQKTHNANSEAFSQPIVKEQKTKTVMRTKNKPNQTSANIEHKEFLKETLSREVETKKAKWKETEDILRQAIERDIQRVNTMIEQNTSNKIQRNNSCIPEIRKPSPIPTVPKETAMRFDACVGTEDYAYSIPSQLSSDDASVLLNEKIGQLQKENSKLLDANSNFQAREIKNNEDLKRKEEEISLLRDELLQMKQSMSSHLANFNQIKASFISDIDNRCQKIIQLQKELEDALMKQPKDSPAKLKRELAEYKKYVSRLLSEAERTNNDINFLSSENKRVGNELFSTERRLENSTQLTEHLRQALTESQNENTKIQQELASKQSEIDRLKQTLSAQVLSTIPHLETSRVARPVQRTANQNIHSLLRQHNSTYSLHSPSVTVAGVQVDENRIAVY